VKTLIEKLSGLDNVVSVSRVDWALGHDWPPAVLFLLLAGALAFAVWSYRAFRDRGPRVRVAMTFLRAAALALVLCLFFEPALNLEFTRRVGTRVLVLLDTSESMSIRDAREHDHDVRDAALALGVIASRDDPLPDDAWQAAAAASRMELATGILTNRTSGLAEQIAGDYAINMFRFGQSVRAVDDSDDYAELAGMQADERATALGTAMRKAAASYSSESIVGMVVLSDFAWNRGGDPLDEAVRLKDRDIPIHTIGIGLVEPPDVSVTRIYARELLFAGDTCSVKVQIKSTPSFARSTGALDISLGETKQSRMITFRGDSQVEEFTFEAPQTDGTYSLDVTIRTLGTEAVIENNTASKNVKVTDEKIRVLYVESLPRWEYRYLRWVLMRDHRLDVRFLLTGGDPELAATSPYYLYRFPQFGDVGTDFDLIILGDVPATYFNTEQIRWMEELVRRRGGAVLMMSGPGHAPVSYRDTQIADLLPVRIELGPWEPVSKIESPTVTEEGRVSSVPVLTDDINSTDEIWRRTQPLQAIPPVTAKPGATVLMGLSSVRVEGEPYPFLAWHRYGSGKTMFLASGKLWRIRYKVGRKHHERFWAQTIQFMALSRLLAGNKRVTIETDRSEYGTDESVQVFANVLNPFLDPVSSDEYVVHVSPVEQEGDEEPVRLTPVPDVPGFYQGSLAAREPGRYQVMAAAVDRESANSPTFEVRDVSLEMREPGMRLDIARKLAELSEGMSAGSSDEISQVVGSIKARSPLRKEQVNIEIWDKPWIFALLALFAGLEWILRRLQRMV